MDGEETNYNDQGQAEEYIEDDDMGASEFSLYVYSDESDNVIDLISDEDGSRSELHIADQPINDVELIEQDRDIDGYDESNTEKTEIYYRKSEDVKEYENKQIQTSPSLFDNYLVNFSKPVILSNENVDESCICTICLEPWTINTEHQLVSLKCGHLFGESCIARWISEAAKKDSARCPNCNALAKKHHIRKIYAKTIRLDDSEKIAKTLKEIEQERFRRLEIEKEIIRNRECLKNVLTECEKTKRAIFEEEKHLEALRSNKINSIAAMHKANVLKARLEALQLKTVIDLNQQSGSRVLTTSDILGVIIATQKSVNNLFSGYGLRKINTYDFKANEFIPIHQNIIKDACFHPHDALVLTASLDQTLKLSNLMSCSSVLTQNLETDAWSCCWNEKDTNYLYVGLRNGKILEFDIRMSQNYVNEIIVNDRVPVSSLQYFIKEDNSFEGIVATHLKSCHLHVKNDSGQFESYSLPIVGNFISSHFDKKSNMLLISSRPNKTQVNVNHSIYQLMMSEDEESTKCLNAEVIAVFNGGRRADQFLKSKIFSHPNDINSSLVVAGDQDAGGYFVWDFVSREKLQEVKCSAPAFDISLMKLSTSNYILAALTENKIFIHKWFL